MAVGTIPNTSATDKVTRRGTDKSEQSLLWKTLHMLGSLKITVVMFCLGIFILLVGTLAQDELNMPDVKARYFNSFIAFVALDDFEPVTVFGEGRIRKYFEFAGQNYELGFPVPGGATIGFILLINLIAAKATRFTIAAHGNRLYTGIGVALLGSALITLVILSGHTSDGLQGKPPISYDNVWLLMQFSVGGFLAALIFAGAPSLMGKQKMQLLTAIVLWSTVAVLASVLIATIMWPSLRFPDPAIRILWQLLQSSVAGLVLLTGLVLIFGNRGGNVLIHIAVGIVMFGQFAFGDRQIEERMSLIEGQTTNVTFRLDEVELAVIDSSDPEDDAVTVVPFEMLEDSEASQSVIANEQLPFDIRVKEYFTNSVDAQTGPNDPENPATAGLGKTIRAKELPKNGGVSSKPNIASAYIELFEKGSEKSLGTYLVTQYQNDRTQLFLTTEPNQLDQVDIGGKKYSLQLRYRRAYKPYQVTLTDVRRINYSASETPRDYSSYVTFENPESKSTQESRIWMNNPVRFKGETFYQSEYNSFNLGTGRDIEMTGLQVVENAGWMVPYVACALAMWGMLYHFGHTFIRFASRYDRETKRKQELEKVFEAPLAATQSKRLTGVSDRFKQKEIPVAATGIPAKKNPLVQNFIWGGVALVLVGSMTLNSAITRETKEATVNWGNAEEVKTLSDYQRLTKASREFDWNLAGTIPMMHEGRIKPLDTVARNILQALSNKTSVSIPNPDAGTMAKLMGRDSSSIPATQWMLGVLAGEPWTENLQVFRIDAKEVKDLFDLEDRKGFRYTFAELEPNISKLFERCEEFREKPMDSLSFGEKKLTEFKQKIMIYDILRFSYQTPPLPEPSEDEQSRERFFSQLQRAMQVARQLDASNPPAAIPPVNMEAAEEVTDPNAPREEPQWKSLYPAVTAALVERILSSSDPDGKFEPNPAILAFSSVLSSSTTTPLEFQRETEAFLNIVKRTDAVRPRFAKTAYEAWFNRFNPAVLSIVMYIIAGLLVCTSFIIYRPQLRSLSLWMMIGIFLVHSFAIYSRILLVERAPVINLYSSAVFIGWACVLSGIVLEAIFRINIGNVLAALTGPSTLLVAYSLDQGDTMHVLQAVLDTQFWLSTHVISIALGYAATFVAGTLGIIAIVHRVYSRYDRKTDGQRTAEEKEFQFQLYRITYGIVCFGIFFSFVGTVLGGLWADDSWGRFWGWDPKENGALMIVLWNAALLHARWDKWVGQRGFALLAIFGNIITAWSWFGTNQLGIGLHSYGFTSGVLITLALVALAHLLIIVVGFLFTMPIAREEKNEPSIMGEA